MLSCRQEHWCSLVSSTAQGGPVIPKRDDGWIYWRTHGRERGVVEGAHHASIWSLCRMATSLVMLDLSNNTLVCVCSALPY